MSGSIIFIAPEVYGIDQEQSNTSKSFYKEWRILEWFSTYKLKNISLYLEDMEISGNCNQSPFYSILRKRRCNLLWFTWRRYLFYFIPFHTKTYSQILLNIRKVIEMQNLVPQSGAEGFWHISKPFSCQKAWFPMLIFIPVITICLLINWLIN